MGCPRTMSEFAYRAKKCSFSSLKAETIRAHGGVPLREKPKGINEKICNHKGKGGTWDPSKKKGDQGIVNQGEEGPSLCDHMMKRITSPPKGEQLQASLV